MELITEKPVKQFDTSAIAKGNLIYAKHSSWDAGKSGFVTGVNGNEIAVQFHPGHWECDEFIFLSWHQRQPQGNGKSDGLWICPKYMSTA